ncbi:MAG: amidohydrolase, partial [Gemmatimonadales bacterium]
GEPLGIFKDQAMALVARAIPAPSGEQRDSALARALAHAASLGVTAVAHMSAGPAELASYRRIEAAGRLTARVALFFPLATWREVADTVARAGAGDDWLWIGGLKGYVDGSAGSRTAYFFEPFSDSAGYAGLMQTAERDLRAWIGGADSAGLRLAIHAIGDRANALLLDILDSVARAHDVDGPRERRFRDEHAQHLRARDIPRFAKIPVVASMQPYHAIDDGRWLEKRIGPRRIRTTYAFRDLLDAGAPLAFGSDWTVAPLDPLLGVYAAVTRRTLDGRHPDGWVPEQKITVAEALRAYTAGNAWALFAEQKWGTLAPGYYADVVVLDRDLLRVPPESIPEARVTYTVVGGRVVYRRSP